jgi:hypothetical protein
VKKQKSIDTQARTKRVRTVESPEGFDNSSLLLRGSMRREDRRLSSPGQQRGRRGQVSMNQTDTQGDPAS